MATKKTIPKKRVNKEGGLLPHPALEHLKKSDPLLYAAALPHHEDILASMSHRRKYPALFPALAGSVVSQQLSTKAADTIWARLEKACKGDVTPESILRLRETTMRKAGLSAAKVKTLKQLSSALTQGTLDLRKLAKMREEDAVAALSAVWGIGRWTAEMFLMFALQKEDVFSPGDLGLRRSIEALYGLPKDAPITEIEVIAQSWSPHRSYACRVLWRVRDSRI
jgi:DNA-3-methyladenine glycosylase II